MTKLKLYRLILGFLLSNNAWSAERIALLIANTNTGQYSPLEDTTNIENSLKSLGFVVKKETNANLMQMKRAIRHFNQEQDKAQIAFFYYAGSSIYQNGQYYLVPMEAIIDNSFSIDIESIALADIVNQDKKPASTLLITVLNTQQDDKKSANNAKCHFYCYKPELSPNTLLAFANRDYRVKNDQHVYAQYLARYLLIPNIELKRMFTDLGQEIKLNNYTQSAVEYHNLNQDWYLKSCLANSSC